MPPSPRLRRIPSVDFKDYYATLGIPRHATEDDIKKAFRKLARQHHPDVATDKKAAEEKFKEINEAYEVLGDPATRKKYDTLGAAWRDTGTPGPATPRPGRRPHRTPGPEFHFHGTGFSDFFEQFFGAGAGGHPSGEDFNFDFEDIPPAHAQPRPRRGPDIEGDILVTLHEVLHGTQRPLTIALVNPATHQREERTVTVRIPPGAPEGRRIRIPGHGSPGTHGGEPGDLFLRVRYAQHPDFRTREGDLYYDLDLAPWEAVLGTEVHVPGLHGAIKVKIPPGTQQGSQLRLKGQGLPQGKGGHRGDLYVITHLQIPTQTTPAERELWQQLARTSPFQPRT